MTADHPTPAERGIPNLDAPFDLAAARDATRRYEGMTDAEYIDDQAAFTKAYMFAAHRSARHLRAALAELARRDAALADLTRQRDEAQRSADYWKKRTEAAWERGDEQGLDRLSEFVDLRAQLERQAPVIEAARALVADWKADRSSHGGVLVAAVDALGPVEPEATAAWEPKRSRTDDLEDTQVRSTLEPAAAAQPVDTEETIGDE